MSQGTTGTVEDTRSDRAGTTHDRRAGVVAWAGAIPLLAVAAYVAWGARLLRPVADDYCAHRSLGYWWANWSGDLTARLNDYVWVGLPTLHLPWPVVSAVPFLASVIALSTAAAALMVLSTPPGSRRDTRWLVVASGLPAAWWAYWWVPAQASAHLPSSVIGADAVNLAQSITGWQTVNAPYVLLPSLLLLGLLGIRPLARRSWWVWLPVFSLFGVVVGTAGLVLAGFTLLLLAATALVPRRGRPLPRPAIAAICAGVAVGAVLSYRSPGSRIRSGILREDPALPSVTPGSLLRWVLPEAPKQWLLGLANPGTVVVVALLCTLAFLAARAGLRPDPRRLAQTGGWVILASFVLSLVNRTSEAFAYPAFWHQLSTGALIFAAVALLSVATGIRLEASLGGWTAVVPALVLLTLAVGVAANASLTLVDTARTRAATWQAGPAPLGIISDLESGWRDCWSEIAAARDDEPARTP